MVTVAAVEEPAEEPVVASAGSQASSLAVCWPVENRTNLSTSSRVVAMAEEVGSWAFWEGTMALL